MKWFFINISILLFEQMNTNQQIEFTFKLAYTEKTKTYKFNPNITIINFIESIKNQAYNDFDLYSGYNIEILETCQYNNINGRNAELAPALVPLQETVRQIYGNRYKNTSFYLRIIIQDMIRGAGGRL